MGRGFLAPKAALSPTHTHTSRRPAFFIPGASCRVGTFTEEVFLGRAPGHSTPGGAGARVQAMPGPDLLLCSILSHFEVKQDWAVGLGSWSS